MSLRSARRCIASRAGDLCAECGACAGLFPGKIEMEMAPPGFLRPCQTAPLTADEDAAFTWFCPALGQAVAAQGRADHVLWEIGGNSACFALSRSFKDAVAQFKHLLI